MSPVENIPQPEDGLYVLVTGANSGLGLGIGARLIDEFLETRPRSESLVLIITTRDQRKGDATVQKLQEHLQKVCRKAERSVPGMAMELQRRVHFRQERLDLLSLVSVQKLAKRLRDTTPKLDAVIFNAGIGGWTSLNWRLAAWELLTGWKTAFTYPGFKVSAVGWKAKPQIPDGADGKKRVEEPPLGEVFLANVFGHYLLGHYLAPLLARHDESEQMRGRIIWVGSLDAFAHAFDFKDAQCFHGDAPYESSKRLTDLLAIASRLPSSAPLVGRYLAVPKDKAARTTQPRIYVSHPGICGTSIFPLPVVLEYLYFFGLLLARWLGSQWHPTSVYKGACAMVWLALADQGTLDSMEESEGLGKWGSATDWWGHERVERTEVDGWGWGGKVGEVKRKGRSPYARDLREGDTEKFEEEGRRCWMLMEALREEWEARLRDAGIAVELD